MGYEGCTGTRGCAKRRRGIPAARHATRTAWRARRSPSSFSIGTGGARSRRPRTFARSHLATCGSFALWATAVWGVLPLGLLCTPCPEHRAFCLPSSPRPGLTAPCISVHTCLCSIGHLSDVGSARCFAKTLSTALVPEDIHVVTSPPLPQSPSRPPCRPKAARVAPARCRAHPVPIYIRSRVCRVAPRSVAAR